MALENVNAPALASILEGLRAEELAAQTGDGIGLKWMELVGHLAARPEVETWIKIVWGSRDGRFENPHALANFLLLREFMRRPRRGNTLETLGLARLNAPTIQGLPAVRLPSVFKEIGGALQDWKDFLSIVLTFLVRANGAAASDSS